MLGSQHSNNTELIPFEFNNSVVVRTTLIGDEPWFIRNDVCKALGLTNPSMATANFDEQDLSTTEGLGADGRKRKVVYVNEPGLYQLIFQSRKPEARTFKRWVTHDVLPALRKTGAYSVKGEPVEEAPAPQPLATTDPVPYEHPAITAQHVIQEKLKTLQLARGLVDSIQLQARAWLLIDGMDKAPRPHRRHHHHHRLHPRILQPQPRKAASNPTSAKN